MLMDIDESGNIYYAPTEDEINSVVKTSTNDVFQKPRFEKYLQEYKENGLYCTRPKMLTKARAEYYETLHSAKLQRSNKKSE